ncbi:MAG TPA: TadE family protein, partial [Chloroflexota bacterium]
MRRDQGQGLIEFALVLPLLVSILIAALLLARVLWSHQVVWALAGEAARAGALGASAADADQRARDRAGQMADDTSLDS